MKNFIEVIVFFWDLEKKFYLDMFPHNKGLFENYDGNEAAL